MKTTLSHILLQHIPLFSEKQYTHSLESLNIWLRVTKNITSA